jgi:hypothetical protein
MHALFGYRLEMSRLRRVTRGPRPVERRYRHGVANEPFAGPVPAFVWLDPGRVEHQSFSALMAPAQSTVAPYRHRRLTWDSPWVWPGQKLTPHPVVRVGVIVSSFFALTETPT